MMDPTGPDGAPRDDGLDVRWGSDWRYIVSLYPDTKPYLWGLAAEIWDQGARSRAGVNPFWRDEPPNQGDRMPNLVQMPPLLRTIIYYALGILNAANVAAFLVYGSDNKVLLAAQVFLGALSGLFFGVAASNVRAEPSRSLLLESTETPDHGYDARHDVVQENE